jgi:hypothetical protein
MHTLTIIELEEGALTLTFGVRVGRRAHVTRCHRLPLPDLSRDTLVNTLRPLAADLLQDTPGVHVILGERRTQHFVSAIPKMSSPEVVDFTMREALRLTSMPTADEVLVATRLVRRTKGGKFVVGATALPRNVWEPVREAFRACNIPVLGMHSTEACLAAGAFATMKHTGAVRSEAAMTERCAVVEVGAGRARFVLCDGKSAVQVRRFMVGTAENNPDALTTQLAMELPRTIDWLRESGHQVPSVLVLGHRIGIAEESFDLIRGDLARVVRAEAVSVTGDVVPSLASTALLCEIATGDALPSLLSPQRLHLPATGLRMLAVPAIVAAGGLCSLLALQEYRTTLSLRDQIGEALEERESLRQKLVEADVVIRTPFESQARMRQLAMAVGLRRPVSRLVAEISSGAVDDILLDGLQFASNERVVVTGVVRGASRTGALAVLSEFASHVRGLPYLDADAQEDVSEVVGQPNQFRFRLGMAWRDS